MAFKIFDDKIDKKRPKCERFHFIYIYIYYKLVITSNKHPFSINKSSIKTKTQNYYILIHYDTIIYENEIWHASKFGVPLWLGKENIILSKIWNMLFVFCKTDYWLAHTLLACRFYLFTYFIFLPYTGGSNGDEPYILPLKIGLYNHNRLFLLSYLDSR